MKFRLENRVFIVIKIHTYILIKENKFYRSKKNICKKNDKREYYCRLVGIK